MQGVVFRWLPSEASAGRNIGGLSVLQSACRSVQASCPPPDCERRRRGRVRASGRHPANAIVLGTAEATRGQMLRAGSVRGLVFVFVTTGILLVLSVTV